MKTILKSLAAIIAVGAIAGGATFAYFSDTETTGMNMVEAGTLDLELNSGDSAYFPIDIQDAYPGMKKETTFKVKNNGSIAGHLRIDVVDGSIVDSENGANDAEAADENPVTYPDGELCENLKLSLWSHDDNQFIAEKVTLADLPTLDPNDVMLHGGDEDTLTFTVMVDGSVDNRIQSDKCGANFEITLIQDVDQDGTGDDDEGDVGEDFPETF